MFEQGFSVFKLLSFDSDTNPEKLAVWVLLIHFTEQEAGT